MSVSKPNAPQIKSKERVAQLGEVFTAEREVNAMLDLVKDECLRPDSRFLEPACGNGNFLTAILERKLAVLRKKYRKSYRDYEKLSIVAIGSLYGIDIMKDNVTECRERLFDIWNKNYTAHCKTDASDETRQAARFIIEQNIINGNALTLMCVDAEGNDTTEKIKFSEWAFINGSQMQRSDYTLAELLDNDTKEKKGKRERKGNDNMSLFPDNEKDDGGTFLKRYITHYKKVQCYGE